MAPGASKHRGKTTEIPALEDDGNEYINWKIRINKWTTVTNVPKAKRATLIQLALGDKGFQATKWIPDEILKSSEGVKTLLETLDEIYIPDKLRHRIAIFAKFNDLRRKENESILDHMQKFMDIYQEYRSMIPNFTYDDSTLALQLLTSSKLSEEDTKVVSAQMQDPPNSKDLQKIMRRVFAHSEENKKLNEYKDNNSDIFIAGSSKEHKEKDSSHTTLYTRDKKGVFRPYTNRSPPGVHRSRSPHHQRRSRSPQNNRFERNTQSWDKRFRNPKKNSIGPDGCHLECNFCSSVWHFINDCPDFHKHRKEFRERKSKDGQEVNLSF